MPLSLKEVFNLPVLSRARVLTAAGSLAGREAAYISVIEVPVEDFVRENELVLTTGMGCGGDLQDFLALVRDIHLARACALIVSVGKYILKIPQEAINYAQENDFVLAEIPWEVRFADITEAVLASIHHWLPLNQGPVKHDLPGAVFTLQGGMESEGISHILKSLGNDQELLRICRLTLEELLAYDRRKGADLMGTLSAYIKNRANVSKTAKDLNLHRQSLLYRLERIEQLTNRSLADPKDLFLLELSVYLQSCVK